MIIGPHTETHDELHPPPDDTDPDWAETCWFAFAVPQRRLSGQLYAYFKPTLGVVAAGLQLWDISGDQTWNCLYSKVYWHLPIPEQPLSRMTLANGARYRLIAAGSTYTIGYTDPDGDELHLNLTFSAIARAHLLGDSHLDQPGIITGELILRGETIPVDAYGFRDRSWGPRPQSGAGINATPIMRGGYSYATASPNDAFHALTMDFGDGTAIVIHGYLLRDGRWGRLVSGRRDVVECDPGTGAPTEVRIEACDEHGRTVDAAGTTLNRLGYIVNPNLWSWNCLTEWTWDGITGFGEDHDNWSLAGQREFNRHLRAAVEAGALGEDSVYRGRSSGTAVSSDE